MKHKKMIKAGKSYPSKDPIANNIEKNLDERNISLDLSFPTLLTSVCYDGFSNYFQTASAYMLYEHYLNSKVFSRLSEMTKKEFMGNEVAKKHVHKLDNQEKEFVIQILKKSLEEKQYPNIDEFIKQNLSDENEFWQYGLERSNGRIVGIFINENVFMPILYDPNHLIHKTSKGHERRFTDAKNYKFSPLGVQNIQYPKKCIHCNCNITADRLVIPFEKDIGLSTKAYICYDCFEKMIFNHYGGNNSEVKESLILLQEELSVQK